MNDPASEPLLRHVAATVHGRMLVRPAAVAGGACWLIGFHGYAQSAGIMLESLARTPRGPEWLLASVQALHPFYTTRTDQVVANWMTREDRELAIADNIAYVDAALDELERGSGPPRAIVFAGFSQGVAMAYRAAVRGRRAAAAIVAAGGDVPPELRQPGEQDWPRVLAATGTGDGWYTPARLDQDVAFLRTRCREVRPLVFDGGHEWSDAVVHATGALLAEIAAER